MPMGRGRGTARLLVAGALGVLTLSGTSPALASASSGVAGTTATAACAGRTYAGNYCPGDVRGVLTTSYGVRKRIYLGGVNVVALTPTQVTVTGWSFCPPEKFGGASMDSITLSWSGTNRPALGDVAIVYGRTRTATLTPLGFVKTGYCDPIYGC